MPLYTQMTISCIYPSNLMIPGEYQTLTIIENFARDARSWMFIMLKHYDNKTKFMINGNTTANSNFRKPE